MLLTVRHPTPTTVLYTVSTRSQNKTFAAQAQRFIRATLRVLVGLSTLLLLVAKARLLRPVLLRNALAFTKPLVHGTAAGRLAHSIAVTTSWRWILPLGLTVLWLIFRKGYTEESLLVLRGLGVQTSTSSPTYLSTAATRFIPTNMIQDVFIHEAFKAFEVRFYLSIVVDGEEDVVVVFPNLLPKRQILEEVWRGSRACLYEPKS